VCERCTRITGVREMPPSRRRVMPCVRCNHTRLIRFVPRELSVETGIGAESGDANAASYGPMFATYVLKRVPSGSKAFAVRPPQPQEGFGMLEACICRRCGFVDWYCQDPDSIPIGPEYMTEEVDAGGSGDPYR
jgi:hypothetical protein